MFSSGKRTDNVTNLEDTVDTGGAAHLLPLGVAGVVIGAAQKLQNLERFGEERREAGLIHQCMRR